MQVRAAECRATFLFIFQLLASHRISELHPLSPPEAKKVLKLAREHTLALCPERVWSSLPAVEYT